MAATGQSDGLETAFVASALAPVSERRARAPDAPIAMAEAPLTAPRTTNGQSLNAGPSRVITNARSPTTTPRVPIPAMNIAPMTATPRSASRPLQPPGAMGRVAALLFGASDYVSWFTSPTVGLALGATILAGVSPERRDVVRPRHVGVAVRAGTAPR